MRSYLLHTLLHDATHAHLKLLVHDRDEDLWNHVSELRIMVMGFDPDDLKYMSFQSLYAR